MSWSVHLVFLLLVLSASALDALKPEPRPNCADHFLNGQFRTGVLPLEYEGEVYSVECVMPRIANNFPDPQVETTIRNALEKTHELLGEKRTIGYQIANWAFLADIVRTQQCEQEMTIDWQPLSVDGSSQGFAIESVLGQRREFVANYTKGVTEYVKLTSDQGPVGVVHLLPTGNSSFTAKIKLSTLRCRQKVIQDHACKFELNAAHDKIGVATSGANELSFSFQTDKPTSGLLRLQSSSADLTVRIEDGYLISSNRVSYPIRALADGNFHNVHLNFKTRILRIDGQSPAISFDSSFLKDSIKQVDILVNGTATAIRLDNGDWHCNKSRYLTVKELLSAPLRQFCPMGEPSFCQCKAPASVIGGNNGFFNTEPKCNAPNAEKGFTLKRDPSKLSFFYFPHTSVGQATSVVFKSDAHSGLIFFGQRKGGTGVERYQVHYTDDTVSAGACLQDGINQWVCRSCEIKRVGGIANNDWIRVSLFNSSGTYLYLTVDDQICLLAHNDNYSSHKLYKGPEKLAFLFVGGTYYKKLNLAESETKSDFKSDFYELTNLKPLSIRGCIAEIRVDGKAIDLVKQFNQQANQVLKESSQKAQLFAMTRGCNECSLQCNGLPCRSQLKKQFCDCSFGYGGLPTDDGKCSSDGMNALWLNSSTPMVLSVPIHPPYQKHVSKMWTLIRLPQVSEPAKVIDFARFHVVVDGKTVVIGSDWYGIRKEFQVSSFDERLHLISVEKAPVQFESRKRFIFRVDSQTQEELLHTENSLENEFDVTLTTLKSESQKFGGCVEGIYFALETDREQESEVDFVDVNKRLAAGNNTRFFASKLQVHRQSCGIIDPNLWKQDGVSSPLGFVSTYDPYGSMQKIQREEDSVPWLLIILLLAIVLFFAILACIYFIMKYSGKRTYVLAKESAVEETRPLYVDSNNSPQSVKVHVGPNDEQKNPEVYNTTVIQTPKSTNVALASKSDL